MTDRITIFGYGAVGRATAIRLVAEGREVIIAQRRMPPDLPKGATFAPCNVLDRDAVGGARRQTVRGRDRLQLLRRCVARGVAADDRQFRRRLNSDRRAHGVYRQSPALKRRR
jgi:nucleoside-diphosphate-sugar epimerase